MPERTLTLLGVKVPDRPQDRRRMFLLALLFLGMLTVIESYFSLDVSLGVFYTVPVVIAAFVLNRAQIVWFGIICAIARAPFTPAASTLEHFLRFVMAAIAYCGSGLLVVEMSNHRRRIVENYARLKLERDLRRRAEEQLQTLAESSPAAIFTLDNDSTVLAANNAAHEMLGYVTGTLPGEKVDAYFPVFAAALHLSRRDRPVRTSVTGWAKRRNGQVFPLQSWFSVYAQGEERHLAAIVVDMSDEVREREREHFQQLLDYNRLLAGAVSHEIRNLCSAISVVCSNLRQRPDLQASADFDALTRLVDGLARLASFKLQHKPDEHQPHTSLNAVLDQLRLITEPDWEEIDGTLVWIVPPNIPAVAGDAHSLLQIFLNLCQNSLRAVENSTERQLAIAVELQTEDAVITFADSGPGVTNPELLFQPFRPEADGSGLGLFISRELARSFSGELHYVPTDHGCEFRVSLPYAPAATRD